VSTDPRQEIRFCPRCGHDRLDRRVPARDDKERTVCAACGYVHYVGPVLAAGVLVRDGDRLCMVRRALSPGEGLWTFPGGFVDLGEQPAEAALREAREEAGCEARIEGLVGAYGSEGPRGKQVVILVYAAQALSVRPVDCPEVHEVAWFARPDLPADRYAFPSTAVAIADYFARAAG